MAQSSDPGEIEYTKLGEIIRCPWHGWEFDIRTGQSYCDPKRFRARAYTESRFGASISDITAKPDMPPTWQNRRD